MKRDRVSISTHGSKIQKQAEFLIKNGFMLDSVRDYIIQYKRDNISIIIYAGRYLDKAEVIVNFSIANNKSEDYPIGWIINVVRYSEGASNIFEYWNGLSDWERIERHLCFVKENFNKVTNIEFCRECHKLIEENYNKGNWKPKK